MKNIAFKANKIIVPLLLLTLLVGTLAYYTDRVSSTASVTTVSDGVDITPLPDPTAKPDDPTQPDPEDYEDPTPNDPDDDLANWWLYLNSRAKVNFNPGDKMTLDYILKNSGTLAVDVRETFIVTSTEPLSEKPEFRLFTSYTTDNAGAHFGDEVVVTEERLDDKHYKYTVASHVLSSESETIENNPVQEEKNYYLVFDALSSNDFQAATCKVDYVVEAKQHSDDADDWAIAATGSLTLDGFEIDVVPENVATSSAE